MVIGVERSKIVTGSGLTWWKVRGIIHVTMNKLEEKDKFSTAAARR